MVAERVRRAEPCAHENCGSRRFYLEDDGYTYCDQGHQQSEGTVVTRDTGELIKTGKKSKRVDSEGESIATSRSGFTRTQAFEHYLLCLQLILRKQLKWLIDEKGFPAELELVVKDLWALRIQHAQPDTGADGPDSNTGSQMFSSQSETDVTTDAEGMRSSDYQSSGVRRRKGKASAGMNMLDMIALLHTGMILLHLPVGTADLCLWVSSGQLLYYYSSRAPPADLRRCLPGYLQQLLDPETLLKGQDLQLAVNRLISQLSAWYGMQCPPINHTLLLYRWLETLALPIEIFAAVYRLARMLDIEFDHKDARSSISKMPELRLMALVVVATKLLFPVDELERCSASTSELSALVMDWNAWSKSDMGPTETGRLRYDELLATTNTDCLAMSDERLDEYLDWYQQNIANEHVNERGKSAQDADFRRATMNLFPVAESVGAAYVVNADEEEANIAERLEQSQNRLTARPMVHELHEPLPVGAFYRRYRRADDLEAASAPAQKLYELSARQSGVSVELMVRAVFFLENMLKKREEIANRKSAQ